MYRVYLTLGLVVLAALLVVTTYLLGTSESWTGLTLNLGSEIFGLALTVAIVDWLIERNKLREEAQRIAWATLHEIDHAVWVWQGGRREFHLNELASVLSMVEEDDPIPPFTQNLLANLGVQASGTLRLQAKVLKVHKPLKRALTYLSGLGQIRELSTMMPPSFVVDAIQRAIAELATVTGQDVQASAFGVAKGLRDPSVQAQESRYRGGDPAAEGPMPNRGASIDGRARAGPRAAGSPIPSPAPAPDVSADP